MPELSAIDFSSIPVPVAPRATLAWEARVTTTPRQSMGRGPAGERYIIPITGGSFDGPMGLRGTVVPGGADRQLWRPDGVRELDALYEMQHEDGSVFTIHNQVTIHEEAGKPRYAFSHVKVKAPEGPHGWLNQRVFIGTLHSLPPGSGAVVIRVWMLQD